VTPEPSFDDLYERALSVLAPRRLSAHAEAGGVGAALLAGDGAVYLGVCVETACQMGFCAEHAAAAAMLTAGESRVRRMVAVNWDGRILPPCGRCREFVSQLDDGNLHAEVLVARGVVRTLQELLPNDWRAVVAKSG
jgi:cytidine deaminase